MHGVHVGLHKPLLTIVTPDKHAQQSTAPYITQCRPFSNHDKVLTIHGGMRGSDVFKISQYKFFVLRTTHNQTKSLKKISFVSAQAHKCQN